MLSRNTILKLFAGLISLAFLTLAFNAAYNSHYHRIANGNIFHHAHPFKDTGNESPFKKHSHSTCALYFLEFLSLPIALTALSLILSPASRDQNFIRLAYASPFHLRFSCHRILGRAPPAA